MKEHLEALRTSHPGCLLVAFGDVATQLVLRASHETSYRREHLDQLSARAAACFRMMDAAALTLRCDHGPNEATWLQGTSTTIFVRPNTKSSEFLCMVCADASAIDAAIANAHDTLSLVTAEP